MVFLGLGKKKKALEIIRIERMIQDVINYSLEDNMIESMPRLYRNVNVWQIKVLMYDKYDFKEEGRIDLDSY